MRLGILGRMLLPQAVEDVSGIQACIVAELPGDDLQGLGKGVDEQLRLASNSPRMISQVPVQTLKKIHRQFMISAHGSNL